MIEKNPGLFKKWNHQRIPIPKTSFDFKFLSALRFQQTNYLSHESESEVGENNIPLVLFWDKSSFNFNWIEHLSCVLFNDVTQHFRT